MSKVGEEEEDEEERFHDSLDRLLSSASCSCSASEPEEECDPSSNCSPDYHVHVPRFPSGVLQNYEIWTSQPSSVEQRRIRLLCQMGLTRDPKLFHRRSSLPFSSNHLIRNGVADDEDASEMPVNSGCVKGCRFRSKRSGRAYGIVRSRSHEDCGCKQDSGFCFTGSIACGDGREENNGDRSFFRRNDCSGEASRGGNRSPERSSVSSDKSPKIKFDREDDGSLGGLIALDLNVDCNGLEQPDEMCMIKNLDNGKEFVVNKFKEDGTWEKIKEVGTGRQLTMEEFSSEMCVGTSPIVQELMRRQKVEDGSNEGLVSNPIGSFGNASKMKKSSSWLKSIKNVASSVTGHKERRSGDERDTSSEKGGRRSSSATDDSQDVSFHGSERVRVRQYGKSLKEVTSLFKSQEIQAHNGSIWAIQFSLDGRYLASAGEDCVIHVWQVMETERKEDFLLDKFEDGNLQVLFFANGSPEPSSMSPSLDGHSEKKRRGRSSLTRKPVNLQQIMVPETVFALSDKPMFSLQGHLADVLDLSWSKSQQLLSSSMDKTVRLWDLSSKSCLKIFPHNDYVTCIQFNPVDDRYFISGSLDAKVRIWSIPDRQVVDWSDLHEMITAACYTPDGQGALVGSYKGSCRLYNISENKLLQKSQINLQNKKKRSHQKKITGFQFSPLSTSEVIITSADSRIRVIDGVDLVHKFKGFRNTNSQISASVTSNGKYVISASEDSYVYIWRHEVESQPNRSTKVRVTRSYEVFHCQDVSVAIPWPGKSSYYLNPESTTLPSAEVYHHNMVIDEGNEDASPLESGCTNSPVNDGGTVSLSVVSAAAPNSFLFDRFSATWPEEKLVLNAKNRGVDISNRSAWGMVIVTAGLRGEIKTFQNFGLPVRV